MNQNKRQKKEIIQTNNIKFVFGHAVGSNYQKKFYSNNFITCEDIKEKNIQKLNIVKSKK